jgi:hypothetical protein
MNAVMRHMGICAAVVLIGGFTHSTAAQVQPAQQPATGAAAVQGTIPSGFGEAVDRDIARARAATTAFKNVDAALAAGYPRETDCVQYPPHGAMGYHFTNKALRDAILDVEKPEVLVYEKMPDGSFTFNGVEYVVPISAWTKDEPPTIMGQKLKKADKLGIYYLHVWIWKPSPTGVFADWNPDVKCNS